MPLIPITIGPFSKIFVGNSTSSAELTEITGITTGPSRLFEGFEEKYFPGLNKQLQVGTYTATVPFAFYGNELIVHNLARGRSVTQTDRNAPSENTFYTVLLLGIDETSSSSILIDTCRTDRKFEKTFAKTEPGSTPINFTAENPSRYVKIITYGTAAELAVILGIRSPI